MTFSVNIIDWCARAPGLSEAEQWQRWAQQTQGDIARARIVADAPQAKLSALPMMIARRLKSAARLAVECGMTLLQRHTAEALVFTSRHGELERNYAILQALANDNPISPTDFALSVHNSAVGNLTIAIQKPLVSTSLSAGQDTFQQGLLEAVGFLQSGYQRVLLVDFDGNLPEFYRPLTPPDVTPWAHAVALLLEAGTAWRCHSESYTLENNVLKNNVLENNAAKNDQINSDGDNSNPSNQEPPGYATKNRPAIKETTPAPGNLPQSLQFLAGWLYSNIAGQTQFHLHGERWQWRWRRQ